MFNKYNCGVYWIKNTVNNKMYIGSSKDLSKRLSYHRKALSNKKHHNKHLEAAFNLYGEESFVFEKLLICSPDDLLMYEQLFMDYYKSYDKEFGYNIRINAESNTGLVPHNKGKPMSSEQKELLRVANTGRKHTEEHRMKIREKMKGRDTLTKEQRKELGRINKEYLTGKKLPEESLRKREETRKRKWLNGEYSYKVSDETKMKQSLAKKGKPPRPISAEEARRTRRKRATNSIEKKLISNENISTFEMREIQDSLQNQYFNI